MTEPTSQEYKEKIQYLQTTLQGFMNTAEMEGGVLRAFIEAFVSRSECNCDKGKEGSLPCLHCLGVNSLETTTIGEQMLAEMLKPLDPPPTKPNLKVVSSSSPPEEVKPVIKELKLDESLLRKLLSSVIEAEAIQKRKLSMGFADPVTKQNLASVHYTDLIRQAMQCCWILKGLHLIEMFLNHACYTLSETYECRDEERCEKCGVRDSLKTFHETIDSLGNVGNIITL